MENLRGISKIYYLNQDDRTDRKEYMESQLKYWEVQEFSRVSLSKYTVDNYDDWKDLILGPHQLETEVEITQAAIKLSYMKFIRKWLETTDEKLMIVMGDNYDFRFLSYIDFDWNYLMKNIPYDWDCIQLGFNNENVIPCFLHPILASHGHGPSLINRNYAEKLVSLHFVDDKVNFFHKISNCHWKWDSSGVPLNYFLTHCGRTYAVPIIIDNDCNELTRYAYDKWWKEWDESKKRNFFTYGKVKEEHGKVNDEFIRLKDYKLYTDGSQK